MPNRNTFIDPLGALAQYPWPTNHATEEAVTKSRQMGDGAQTSDIGLVPQQGAATPLILKWEGTMFLDSEITAIMQWWNLCEDQTIWLRDFTGSEFEVIITDFDPQRIPCVRNPRCPDSSNPNCYYTWTYSMTLRVVQAFSGIWAAFTPQASS